MTDFNRTIIEQFRSGGGATSGPFSGRLLLLTTTGAKSGRQHTTPLVYFPDADRFVVMASYGGAPRNPAWYHNLRANPEVTVEVPGERFAARAIAATGEERERLFAAMSGAMPMFAGYQQRTQRRIPVIVLTHAG